MLEMDNDYFENLLINNNKVNAKTLEELFEIERKIVKIRIKEFKIEQLPQKFNYQCLKNIHFYLFRDIYEWAGKDRYDLNLLGNFTKDDTFFVPGAKILEFSKEIFDELENRHFLTNLKTNEFLDELSEFFANLNALHPFREGNGRTQRIFINQLAYNAGYKMNLDLIPKDKMIIASKFASKLNYTYARKLFECNIIYCEKHKDDFTRLLNDDKLYQMSNLELEIDKYILKTMDKQLKQHKTTKPKPKQSKKDYGMER